MWAYLTPANLIDIQRACALREMGLRARALLAEGYAADADRILDDLNDRMADWARVKASHAVSTG